MLPSASVNDVGTLDSLISRLNSPACTYPFQRFASVLTDKDAWFGATVGRYSFDVGLFHSFLHAGLSRRSNYSGPGGQPGVNSYGPYAFDWGDRVLIRGGRGR